MVLSCERLSAPAAELLHPEHRGQKLRAETAASVVGIGADQRSDWPGLGSAELRAAAQNNREDAAADGRRAWEASLCLDSPRLHQQSHEGTGRRCCAGFSGLPQELDHSSHPRSSGIGTYPTSAECVEAARIAWGGGGYKLARSAMREQGRSKTGIPSLPHVKLSPMSAPGSTGQRQEHLAQELVRGDACFEALTF